MARRWIWVTAIAIAVIWVCGTLPWVMIGNVLCSQRPPLGCANPHQFRVQASFILTLDFVLVAAAMLAVHQLKRSHRWKR
jgi:hypothetical protein